MSQQCPEISVLVRTPLALRASSSKGRSQTRIPTLTPLSRAARSRMAPLCRRYVRLQVSLSDLNHEAMNGHRVKAGLLTLDPIDTPYEWTRGPYHGAYG